jgi:hypothetical protein
MLVLLSSTNLINLVNLITWLKNILILNKISKTKKLRMINHKIMNALQYYEYS